MLRFNVGELAIFVLARKQSGKRYVGQVVEIHSIGPFKAGYETHWVPRLMSDADYLVKAADGRGGAAKDWQLVKLGDPDQQVTRQAEEEIAA